MQIPHTALSPEALQNLIEEFVTREGTEYGARDYSLADKVRQVLRQIETGRAVEDGIRSGTWIYRATAAVPLGADIFIELVGYDHAGQRTQHTESPRVGEDV